MAFSGSNLQKEYDGRSNILVMSPSRNGLVAPLTELGNIICSTALNIMACGFHMCLCLWGVSQTR